MKTKKIAVLVAVFALTLTVSAFAGSDKASGKATITLSSAVQVNGTELAPGTYKLKWAENGSGVDVTLTPDGRKGEAVTTKAKLVSLDKKAEGNAVLSRANGSGKPSVTQIRLAGKSQALVLEGASYSSSGN